MAPCRFRSCLPFDLEIEADEKLQRRRQENAARLIQMCVLSWRMGRNPPPGTGDSEEELAAWKSKVRQPCAHGGAAALPTRLLVRMTAGLTSAWLWSVQVNICRFWVMTVAIKKSRISASRLKVPHQPTRCHLRESVCSTTDWGQTLHGLATVG